jgi:phosphopantothenoylcysteine decarboxylase/phosphopantothenate--cysteine ligase
MSEPDEIVAAALAVVEAAVVEATVVEATVVEATPGDLAGRRIVVTAGGTREPLDPVRFIGNRSSGKQGVALALAAAARGAEVTLIGANLEIDVPQGFGVHDIVVQRVGTTLELSAAVTAAAVSADVVIMAAAVADYRPDSVAESKIKKETQGDILQLTLVKNPDILQEISAAKSAARRAGQIIIGFAAETETDPDALLALGRAKIARKGCDYLVLNSVGWTTGFATDGNTVKILDSSGVIVGEASGSKTTVAGRILDLLAR